MADQCRYLEYRSESDGKQFDTERAYCTVVEQFVQPMRADVCNYRYGLAPERHCEYFETAESNGEEQGAETSER